MGIKQHLYLQPKCIINKCIHSVAYFISGKKHKSIQVDLKCLFILDGLSKTFWLKAHNKESVIYIYILFLEDLKCFFDCQFQNKILPFWRFEVVVHNWPLLAFIFRKSRNRERKSLFQVWFNLQLKDYFFFHYLFIYSYFDNGRIFFFLKLELGHFYSPLSAMENRSCSCLVAMEMIWVLSSDLLSVCGVRYCQDHGFGLLSERNGANSMEAESQMKAASMWLQNNLHPLAWTCNLTNTRGRTRCEKQQDAHVIWKRLEINQCCGQHMQSSPLTSDSPLL